MTVALLSGLSPDWIAGYLTGGAVATAMLCLAWLVLGRLLPRA